MDYKLFKEIGFTEREIKVYFALIELGTSTVGPISKKTKLQPAKVYETIEKLKEKGLVSHITISKTKHFQAANPKEILEMLDEKKRQFKEVITELEKKQKYAEVKQIAIVHEGFKSFKALFNRIADSLEKEDYYWAFAFKEEYHNPATALFLRKFHAKLAEKKIDDRLLGHTSVRKAIKKTFTGNENFKIKFSSQKSPSVVIMFKNSVVTLLWGERPTAIEMVSDQINKQYKNFFLESWKKAKN